MITTEQIEAMVSKAGAAVYDGVADASLAREIRRKVEKPQYREVLPAKRRVEDDEHRTLRFIASNERVDRYGDIIRVAGWSTKDFDSNPVFLRQHSSQEEPIGKVRTEAVLGDQPAFLASVEFPEADVSPEADRIYRLYLSGFMRAVSVGFKPLQTLVLNDEDEREELGLGKFGVVYVRQELLELSAVSIPANPDAVMIKSFAGMLDAEVWTPEDTDGLAEAGYDVDGLRAAWQEATAIEVRSGDRVIDASDRIEAAAKKIAAEMLEERMRGSGDPDNPPRGIASLTDEECRAELDAVSDPPSGPDEGECVVETGPTRGPGCRAWFDTAKKRLVIDHSWTDDDDEETDCCRTAIPLADLRTIVDGENKDTTPDRQNNAHVWYDKARGYIHVDIDGYEMEIPSMGEPLGLKQLTPDHAEEAVDGETEPATLPTGARQRILEGLATVGDAMNELMELVRGTPDEVDDAAGDPEKDAPEGIDDRDLEEVRTALLGTDGARETKPEGQPEEGAPQGHYIDEVLGKGVSRLKDLCDDHERGATGAV